MKTTAHKGFTLIELLVVVAIIGLLSSVVLGSLSTARAKARDTQRLADLREIRTALELFKNDNGTYPSTTNTWRGSCSAWGSYQNTGGTTSWIPDLAPKYISVLPTNPSPVLITAPSPCYLYRSDGISYMVLAYTTVETDVSSGTYQPSSPCTLVPGTTNTNPSPRPRQQSESSFAVYTPTPTACAW